jgi:cytochrome c peroxidase
VCRTCTIFKLTCGSVPDAAVYTSDPARALVTGRCADVSRGKVPVLRGLAARAPFFHNGAAASLAQLVEFYNKRFQIGLAEQDKADRVAFLRSL